MSGSALPASQALPLIAQYESGNQNVLNQQGSSASGYYQIINGTWAQYAPQAGVSTAQYPTAMSAPQSVQTAVATALYNAQGITPWQSNTSLIAAYNSAVSNTSGLPSAVTNTAGFSSSPTQTAVNAGISAVTSPGQFATSLINPVWEIVSRGVLLFVGFAFVMIALIAMLFQSKTVTTSVASVTHPVRTIAKLAA